MSIFTNAQNPFLNNTNQQLRHIFSQINYPNNDILFLYERSVKMSDSVFYTNYSTDTTNYKIWSQIYSEMYYAAHDTMLLETINDIKINAGQFGGDTIPIGIMDYTWYYLEDDALTTGDYFDFDIPNNVLHDKSNPIGTPYKTANIFVASPLKDFSTFSNPVFRIDPQFLFIDVVNEPYYQSNTESIRIDFDDGTGWHDFDPNNIIHYEANYTNAGKHTLTVELEPKEGIDKKGSKSDIYITKSTKAVPPDQKLEDIPGLDVGIYEACESLGNERVIIYLEGFDPLDMTPSMDRGIEEIYSSMIEDQTIEQLRNYNYTYYVVNWKNSRIDMRFNALYVLNLLEKLKLLYANNPEQFVIIGESMGGVIARYVLSFMESQAYADGDFSIFFNDMEVPQNGAYLQNHEDILTLGNQNRDQDLVSLNHKTRELITLDSPHQGANVPLSIQYAYRKLLQFIVPGSNYLTSMLNLGLESYAAKEMLLYHIDGKVNPASPISNYQPHPAHFSFYNELKDLGLPQHCKNVALTNGSLKGKRQRNIANDYRTAGDLLLGQKMDLFARVLGFKLPISKSDFKLLTNPNGSGTFYSAAVGTFTLNIKLKLFVIDFNNTFGSIYSDNQIALNVKSYGTSAGGNFSASLGKIISPKSYSLSKCWFLNIFSYDLTSYKDCFVLQSHVGWNGFASVNLEFSLCTDGTTFGFVPLQSALDYGNGMNLALDHNIEDEDINIKLSRTPFDVIIGFPGNKNEGHLNYRDERIFNITGADATNCQYASVNLGDGRCAYYNADLYNYCENQRGLLCLEIGDEELYLENWSLNRYARFQTEYALYINKRNPYYQYPSQNLPPNGVLGAYSKEAPFQITNQGHANFLTNKNDSPINNGFEYNTPQAPTIRWEVDDEKEMMVCVKEYGSKSLLLGNQNLHKKTPSTNQKQLKIYPNPNNGKILMIQADGQFKQNFNVEILDFTGKTVAKYPRLDISNQPSEISLKGLVNGIYFIKLKNNKIQEIQRLIIQ